MRHIQVNEDWRDSQPFYAVIIGNMVDTDQKVIFKKTETTDADLFTTLSNLKQLNDGEGRFKN